MIGCSSQKTVIKNSEEDFKLKSQKIFLLSDALLLKDYLPASQFEMPKTEITKAKYPVIDMHTHVYASTKEEIEEWIQTMNTRGVEKCIVMTQATGAKFDSIFALYADYPDRFDVWCGIDYTGYDQPGFAPNAIAELERCMKIGAKGVGELGDKGKGLFYSSPTMAFGMHPDDPRMIPIFKKCAELNLPVNLHVAEPIWMYKKMDPTNEDLITAERWRVIQGEDVKTHAEMIDILENCLKQNPETTFIACHYANCSYNLDKVSKLLDNYPNLILDISARYFYISVTPRRSSAFYKKYQDRLLYGTDWGRNPAMYKLTFRILESSDEHFYGNEYNFNSNKWPLHGLELSDTILEKLYRKNALELIY